MRRAGEDGVAIHQRKSPAMTASPRRLHLGSVESGIRVSVQTFVPGRPDRIQDALEDESLSGNDSGHDGWRYGKRRVRRIGGSMTFPNCGHLHSLSSLNSHTLANCQSRFTVSTDTSSASAASSNVSPPKNFSSTTWLLRGWAIRSNSSASSRATRIPGGRSSLRARGRA